MGIRPPRLTAPLWLLLLLAVIAGLLLAGALDKQAEAQPHQASWYGYNDGYSWEDNVTATGDPFEPWRVDRTAVALYPGTTIPVYPLGTRLLVCAVDRPDSTPRFGAPAGCSVVVANDTCLGCWDAGFTLDLTAGAFRHITMRPLERTVIQVAIWRLNASSGR